MQEDNHESGGMLSRSQRPCVDASHLVLIGDSSPEAAGSVRLSRSGPGQRLDGRPMNPLDAALGSTNVLKHAEICIQILSAMFKSKQRLQLYSHISKRKHWDFLQSLHSLVCTINV